MPRVAQFGIALGALGIVLALMGLFPGVTGIEPAGGIGILQVTTILVGFLLLILGALIYVKFTFYVLQPATLSQQIGVRLSLTGLLVAAMAGYADILGFGSHLRDGASDIYFGWLQAVGIIGGFGLAAVGVLIYAVMGAGDGGRENDSKG
ncbi:hypothetical protein FBR01_09840 [Anaerolineae bacterium CFX8]|nr:hypothetical protein [Anaerolineae bacterium CFX8]